MGTHRVFVRDATGLVRAISGFDAFLACIGFLAVPLGLFTYTSAIYLFPGSDPVLATIIATAFSLFVSLMYTLFAWAMPRAGGDYVFMSRSLHPSLGFVFNSHLMIWYLVSTVFYTAGITNFAVAPSLLIIGTVTGNQSLIGLANNLSAPLNVTIVGTVLIAIMVLVLLTGVRTTFRLTNVLVILSFVGYAVMLWLLAASSNADFIQVFNKFTSYQGIIQAAHAAGFSPSNPNPFSQTLGITYFIFLTTGFGIATSYYAGEVKSVKKTLMVSQILPTLLIGILLAVLGGLAIRDFGYDFLGSAWFLSSNASSQYPFSVPPFWGLFISMLTGSPAVLWLIAVTWTAAVISAIPPIFTAVSRSFFAWSFDGIIPSKFATVNEKYGSPTYTIVLIGVIAEIALILSNYTSFLTFAAGVGIAFMLAFVFVALAAIVFPFTRKEIYSSSVAKINLGPLPLITVAGVLSLIWYLINLYFLLSNPLYGANIPPTWIAIAATIAVPIVVYVGAFFYRKKQGLDLGRALREIPPE
jgi:APA family basic amino acid/polyamine antiporter